VLSGFFIRESTFGERTIEFRLIPTRYRFVPARAG
jgi:hypothetical protein